MKTIFIEKIILSKIGYDVKFNSGFSNLEELIKFRKSNMSTTHMCWITLQPVIDFTNIYNPKTLIMLILN